MSVIVNNLSKSFGNQIAVNNLSFTADVGRITGFLGPNGAGKSTTLRMICSLLKPDNGEITVCGKNVLENPIETKKSIGYLLENNPLYYKMYVREFLEFLSGIHAIKNKKNRVDEIIEMTGLSLESKKQIGQLSKGYKQRVGIAQALIHDPQVIILDEPTSGLDPNQLGEIRELIRNLGKEKTVIFSSHIMQEVEELCDQVIIIDRGNLVANNTLNELQSKVAQQWITNIETVEKLGDEIDKINGVINFHRFNDHKIRLVSKGDIRKEISGFCKTNDLTILEMTTQRSDLGDIFQSLTGKG